MISLGAVSSAITLAAISLAGLIQLLGAFLISAHRRPWWRAPRYQRLSTTDDSEPQPHTAVPDDAPYFDKDGYATAESAAAVRNIPQRLLIAVSSLALVVLIILSATVPNDLYDDLEPAFKASLVAVCASIVVQTFVLASCSAPLLRFQLGLCAGCSHLLLLAGLLTQVLVLSEAHDVDTATRVLTALYVALSIANAAIALLFNRRPVVYRDGRRVDEQFSTSALSRLSFSWASRLMNIAHSKESLSEDDLPLLDTRLKSEDMKDHLESRPKVADQSLWLLIVKEHWFVLLQQWILAFLESVLAFGPEFAMFNLLRTLERRQASPEGTGLQIEIWLWVLALGSTSLCHFLSEEWLDWLKWSVMELRVRAQLSTIVFSKALRLQDIKDAVDQTINNDDEPEEPPLLRPVQTNQSFNETTPLLLNRGLRRSSTLSTTDLNVSKKRTEEAQDLASSDSDSDAGSDDDEDYEPGLKSVIQLIDVDSSRVSVNITELSEIMSNIIKLIVGLVFLVSILGWLSTLAGIAVPALFAPITKLATSKYTKASTKLSKARDRKSNVISEALNGMRQIKFGALEGRWRQLIMGARNEELVFVRRTMWLNIALGLAFMTMPILLGASALTTYSLTHGTLTASVAFTALSVFSSLERSLSYLPVMVAAIADTQVSLRRLRDFLKQEDRTEYVKEGKTIQFKDASISWPTQEPQDGDHDEGAFTLKHLNLDFPTNGLSVVLGKTGSGKSLLLAGITGEARLNAGYVFAPYLPSLHQTWSATDLNSSNWIIPAAKAFVSQIPWIENASLRNNILYGLPYNDARYRRVIHACALEQDLSILHDGDETEIGASGVNISGGQKWRLTLARALYSRAGILVMDDIFSAVDSHVGRHILDNAILGELGSKRTIIIATHHSDLVTPAASYVVEIIGRESVKAMDHQPAPRRSQKLESRLELPSTDQDAPDTTGARTPRKFVEDESRAKGHISAAVYKAYFKASGGGPFFLLVLLVFTIAAGVALGRTYWIKHFTEGNASTASAQSDENKQSIQVFILGYVMLSLASTLLVGIKLALVQNGLLKASKQLFEQMATAILKTKLQWIDRVPVGRALNRFVGDVSKVDQDIGIWVAYSLNELFTLLKILIAAVAVSSWTLLIIIPLILCMGYVTMRYLHPARDLRRIHSTSESPVLDLVGVALSGLGTIRTFGKGSIYASRMCELIDATTRANYQKLLVTSWMEVRLGFLSTMFEAAIAAYVAIDGRITAATAGFALSLAIDFSGNLLELVMDYVRLELDMNSVERVIEYTQVPAESEEGDEVPKAWPTEGRVDVRDLKVTYADDLPPALKGVSFSINAHERVGIVGRTGSGKSSLTLALFRFLDAVEGSIEIDGVDISSIKLKDLRSRLSIIPQDPVLFTGTVRSNLDPLHKYSDSQVFAALRQVNLIEDERASGAADEGDAQLVNKNVFTDLSSPITRGGLNISHGQRQLVCLARALLGSPRLMLLDEATSAVDMETDAQIQASIRSGFAQSTLIVVAHRLSTIIDFDKVLVMGEGRVLEFGVPLEVFQRGGEFAAMVEQSGEKEKLIEAMQSRALI